MAGNASVLRDGSRRSRIDQALEAIEIRLALVSGLAVFGLMLLAVVSVTGRNLLNFPVPGYVDWIEITMPLIAFMGISYTQRNGGHIRMDILIGKLKGRAMWAVELFSVLVMLVLVLFLIWGSWAHFDRSFDFAAPLWSRDSTIDIRLPVWPAKLLVPFAFSILALRLALQIWAYGRAFVTGAQNPIAVPLPLTAAEQAAEEASHVSALDNGGTA